VPSLLGFFQFHHMTVYVREKDFSGINFLVSAVSKMKNEK
jgi:hypothetical protein